MSHPVVQLLKTPSFPPIRTIKKPSNTIVPVLLSRTEILCVAHEKLRELQKLSGDPDYGLSFIDETLLYIVIAVLDCVVDDDSPTPQFAPCESSGVEIMFWVGTDYLSITIDSDTISFSAWNSEYYDLFEPINVVFNDTYIDEDNTKKLLQGLTEARELLAGMSENIITRCPLNWVYHSIKP